MKYFLISFLSILTSLISFEASALTYNKYYTNVPALRAACNAEARAFEWLYSRQCSNTPTKGYFRPSQDIGHYFRLATLGDANCPYEDDTNFCVSEPPVVACPDFGETTPTCICSDGLPRDSGQWTICDRPPLKECPTLGYPIADSAFCPLVAPDDANGCPTDSFWNGTGCENKCGINAAWNAYTNQCVDNGGNNVVNSCPSGFHKNLNGDCVPDSCPSNQKMVNGACVIDTDPKIDTDTTITTNADGSTTETTVTTTTTNNPDGSQTVTINTTVTEKDATGATTSVDSSSTENTKAAEDVEPEEEKNSVSGGGDCITPPACSGDAIQCGQLHLLWKNACLLEGEEETVTEHDNCSQPFVCNGGVLECARLQAAHINYCESSSTALNSFLDSSLPSDLKALSNTDDDGVLTIAKGTDFNVMTELGITDIFDAPAVEGSCPAPYEMTLFGRKVNFDYNDHICPLAETLNPLIIFAASIFCLMMIYRGIEAL